MAGSCPLPEGLPIDSSHIKAHRPASERWAGRMVSGDRLLAGRPVAYALTPGNIADLRMALPLRRTAPPPRRDIVN